MHLYAQLMSSHICGFGVASHFPPPVDNSGMHWHALPFCCASHGIAVIGMQDCMCVGDGRGRGEDSFRR